MPDSKVRLEIVTPDSTVYSEIVEHVVVPTANGKDQCDTWLAAETEQMCLNNPVLPWDADLEENAASKTLGHALALLVGGVAALLVA